MPRTRVLFAALVAAGCIGAALALGVAFAAGAFDRKTVETRVVQTAAAGGAGASASWARSVYARRVGGVVTVLVDVGPHVVPSGAGFVVDAQKGLIVTNSHVVTNSAEATDPSRVQKYAAVYIQRADGAREPATIVGYDLFDDIAVLHYDPVGLAIRSSRWSRSRSAWSRKSARRSSPRPPSASARPMRSRPMPRSTPATPAGRSSTAPGR
jgi:S1-C subfamily serine protease